jgi:hypothetical protein
LYNLGYTALGYLCEQIFLIPDTLLVFEQQKFRIEHICKLVELIVSRCPVEQLLLNFHSLINNQLNENLFLIVRHKLNCQNPAWYANSIFHRLESIIVVTGDNCRLYAERLLQYHTWNAAISALCDTDGVNISNILRECVVQDQHMHLVKAITIESNFSLVCALVFYALATNVKHLYRIIPITCIPWTTRNSSFVRKETYRSIVDNCDPIVTMLLMKRLLACDDCSCYSF